MNIYEVVEKDYYKGNIEVRSIEIIKETDKIYWLAKRCEWL